MNRIILDTETAGSINDHNTLRVYDLGFVIVDGDFNIIERFSWLIRDVFFEQRELMESAYYFKKNKKYYNDLINNNIKEMKFLDAKNEFKKLCADYEVREIWAYNASFDRDALNATTKAISNGFASFFVPYGVKWCCIQHAATQLICSSRKYYTFCLSNKFVSKSGNISTTAENVFRYLTNNAEFAEDHTALSDALIETEILRKCIKKKKKFNRSINRNCWSIPQKGFKAFLKECQINEQ